VRHLKQLGDRITIPIPTDEEGYVGRECPQTECQGYFKIKLGTGLQEVAPCHCPYCGYTDDHSQFWTTDQREYAMSMVANRFSEVLRKDIEEMDRRLRRQSRSSFVKLSVEFKAHRRPIHYYREKQLETKVVCEQCGLHYAIYGVFSYCPDCGTHNSLQILKLNLELATKEIGLAATVDDAGLAETLITDALENVVSAFDGFGRELCRLYASASSEPEKTKALSFQGLPRAREQVQSLFGFDLAQGLALDEWEFICRYFQKRHLVAHRMGVVDEAYLELTKDPQAVIGRKVVIESNEVIVLTDYLQKLGIHFITQLSGSNTMS